MRPGRRDAGQVGPELGNSLPCVVGAGDGVARSGFDTAKAGGKNADKP